MAKRRGHGEGSIYQRKDGRYAAAITFENRKRKYFYGETRREVQEKLKTAQRELHQGLLATGPQQTIKQFLERWLEDAYKPTVKPLSYAGFRSVITYHLIPAFGSIAVQKLTPDMIRAYFKQKLDGGLKPSMIGYIHKVLRRALEDAMKSGLVARNAAKLVKPPRVEQSEFQVLTVEQAEHLLEVARGSSLDVLLTVALTTGMRRGELLALHWGDIDFDKHTVFVHRTVARISGRGMVESEPKTKSSRRHIRLPAVAVEALKRHRTQQEQMKQVAERWQEKGLVFPGRDGNYLYPNTLANRFNKLLGQAGLPHLRFHDLRHSAATILLAIGVNPKEVQERLGHSSITMTMDVYGHVLPTMQQDAVNKIDTLFQ